MNNELPSIIRGKKRLYPITDKIVVKRNFDGEILECFNCFLPDHPFVTSGISGGGIGQTFQGGVNYGPEYWSSHSFDLDITMAFTALPPNVRFSRMCHIVHDYTNWPPPGNIHTFSRSDVPGGNAHPSDWSAFLTYGPASQWEANALAAFSRAGHHGFEIMASVPNFQPPVGLENSYHPSFMFLDYLRLFQWVRMGNEREWITNNHAKQIITRSYYRNIIPAGHVTTRVQSSGIPWQPRWQHGPDYWSFEFSAFRHDLWGLPPWTVGISPPVGFPFVFWIYDYSNTLGVTLRNLEEKVENGVGQGRIFPRGYIPHEEATGPQNSFWGYRWISNKWKHAPWERYPNL